MYSTMWFSYRKHILLSLMDSSAIIVSLSILHGKKGSVGSYYKNLARRRSENNFVELLNEWLDGIADWIVIVEE